MYCHSGPLCLRTPNAHCSPNHHDLSLDLCLPQALESARATPLNPLHILGNEPRDTVPAAQITSQNGAKQEAPTQQGLPCSESLVAAGGGPPGLGAQLNGEQSPHSHPTIEAPKSPGWGPLPAADRPGPRELQTSSTSQQRHLVAVTGSPTQTTSARPAWTPRSATRPGYPGQCAQPDGPSLPREAGGPPRGLQGPCYAGGSPPWFPAPVYP